MRGVVLTFSIFIAAMVTCVILGWSLAWALLVAVAAFFVLALSRGHRPEEIFKMVKGRLKNVLIILRIFFFIGLLTALWRADGTIAFFIYYGIQIITPPIFILVAFLLTALLSYALGTSFGSTATAGLILISLARFGGVNELVTAGAVISGAYFGDRGSPASSCASLVAAVTGTELYSNVKYMMKTALLPLGLTIAIYAVLSVLNPITQVDVDMLAALGESFRLSPLTVLPAVLMIALPLLKLPIRVSMAISAASAFLIAAFVQHEGVLTLLKDCALGYTPADASLGAVLSGGGLVSMLQAGIIITLTSITTGIIESTGVLEPIQKKLSRTAAGIGLFPTLALLSAAISLVMCNQAVSVMMGQQLMGGIYERSGATKQELSIDIANSGVMICALVPWSIAISIPLSMLGVSAAAIPYAVYVYLVPLCYLFTKKRFFGNKKPVMEETGGGIS